MAESEQISVGRRETELVIKMRRNSHVRGKISSQNLDMRFCSLVTLAAIKDLGPEEIFQKTDGNLKKGKSVPCP